MSKWIRTTLSDVADTTSGATVTASQFGSGTKYITVQQLYYGNSINVEAAPRVKLTNFEIQRFKLNPSDIILGKSSVKRDGIGYPAWFDNYNEPVTFSNFTVKVCAKSHVDQKYLFYWLRGEEARKWIVAQAQHSALTNINQKIIANIPVSFPMSMMEQQKIITILSKIDETMRHTEALIEKYQQIKAGMMNDLFTCGVLPDGTLRPTRDEAPELYHETPIGWIPKEWGYDYLLNLLAPVLNNMRSGPFGSALLKSELSEDGIPFLGIDNIHVEKFVAEFKRFVSTRKYSELNRYATRPNDVVITIMGTVGRCCVIPKELEFGLSSKHLWTMTFDQNKILSTLVCWQLNYAEWVQTWFRREAQGGIMDAIQSKTLKTLILPLPDEKEQIRILDRYLAMNKKIDTETQTLEKLQKQKSGLMHDLLTGEVRVKTAQE